MILKVGDSAEIIRTFTNDDVTAFAQLSLDTNPLHLDEAYAKSSVFGKCVVHGAFVNSLFSTVLGTKLPGPGTIYLSQTTRFIKPVFVNERVTVRVEVTQIKTDKPIAILRTYCLNENNEIVADGEAVVKHPI